MARKLDLFPLPRPRVTLEMPPPGLSAESAWVHAHLATQRPGDPNHCQHCHTIGVPIYQPRTRDFVQVSRLGPYTHVAENAAIDHLEGCALCQLERDPEDLHRKATNGLIWFLLASEIDSGRESRRMVSQAEVNHRIWKVIRSFHPTGRLPLLFEAATALGLKPLSEALPPTDATYARIRNHARMIGMGLLLEDPHIQNGVLNGPGFSGWLTQHMEDFPHRARVRWLLTPLGIELLRNESTQTLFP